MKLILEADWRRAAFAQVQLASANAGELQTTANGSVRALSTGGVFTGLGGDYILFDDPIKQSDAASPAERERVLAFYRGTIVNRSNDPRTGRLVVVMQRVHPEDLAGHLIESGEYQVLNLPAIASEVTTHDLYGGGLRSWPQRSP